MFVESETFQVDREEAIKLRLDSLTRTFEQWPFMTDIKKDVLAPHLSSFEETVFRPAVDLHMEVRRSPTLYSFRKPAIFLGDSWDTVSSGYWRFKEISQWVDLVEGESAEDIFDCLVPGIYRVDNSGRTLQVSRPVMLVYDSRPSGSIGPLWDHPPASVHRTYSYPSSAGTPVSEFPVHRSGDSGPHSLSESASGRIGTRNTESMRSRSRQQARKEKGENSHPRQSPRRESTWTLSRWPKSWSLPLNSTTQKSQKHAPQKSSRRPSTSHEDRPFHPPDTRPPRRSRTTPVGGLTGNIGERRMTLSMNSTVGDVSEGVEASAMAVFPCNNHRGYRIDSTADDFYNEVEIVLQDSDPTFSEGCGWR